LSGSIKTPPYQLQRVDSGKQVVYLISNHEVSSDSESLSHCHNAAPYSHFRVRRPGVVMSLGKELFASQFGARFARAEWFRLRPVCSLSSQLAGQGRLHVSISFHCFVLL